MWQLVPIALAKLVASGFWVDSLIFLFINLLFTVLFHFSLFYSNMSISSLKNVILIKQLYLRIQTWKAFISWVLITSNTSKSLFKSYIKYHTSKHHDVIFYFIIFSNFFVDNFFPSMLGRKFFLYFSPCILLLFYSKLLPLSTTLILLK